MSSESPPRPVSSESAPLPIIALVLVVLIGIAEAYIWISGQSGWI